MRYVFTKPIGNPNSGAVYVAGYTSPRWSGVGWGGSYGGGPDYGYELKTSLYIIAI